MSHSFQTEKVTIIHNGDYSGDAEIVVPYSAGALETHQGVEYVRIHVPTEDLLAFVAEAIRDKMITRIERASADEILMGWHE